jgi:peptide/nickel transport system substrate-binding protein
VSVPRSGRDAPRRPVGRGAALAAAALVALLAVSGASSSPPPQRGGAVVIAGGSEPACITPWIVACASGRLLTLMDSLPQAVLYGAYERRPDLTWRPRLVSHADVTKKEPFTLTYHIRPEARWSDGVPVTAADFVFTHRILRRYRDRLDLDDRAGLDVTLSVRSLDRKTVRVVFPEYVAAWKAWFAIVLPRHVLDGEDYLEVWKERIDNPRTGEPIGSGPFLVSGWKRGKQLTLVRNPNPWAAPPAYLRRLVLRFDAAPTPAEALARGEVDLVWGLDPEAVPSLRGLGVTIRSKLAAGLDMLVLNVTSTGHPLLRKRLVRQAVAYGIDREAIVRDLFGRILPGKRASDNTLYLNSNPYYRPNWGRYRYRPATARRLLERAGCSRGADRMYVCAGQRLALRFTTRADVPSRMRTLRLVQDQLRRVGIAIVPQTASGRTAIDLMFARGDYDLLEYAGFFADAPDTLALSGLECRLPQNAALYGWTRYCRQLDPVELDRANRTLEGAARARAVNAVDAAFVPDVPTLPLYWASRLAAIRTDVRGVVFNPENPFWRAEHWWVVPER